MDQAIVDQVYQDIQYFLHEEEGHIKQVSKQSRQAISDIMAKNNLTPQQMSEVMGQIADKVLTECAEVKAEQIKVKS